MLHNNISSMLNNQGEQNETLLQSVSLC